jgi:glucose/mannose-6-phosphate isomerase
VASSYSGNTEEIISFFEAARARGLNLAVVASGGRLLDLAREHGVPYAALPTDGIQPRVAIGYALKALLALMGREDLAAEVTALALSLKPAERKGEGAALAGRLAGRAPLIYAGTRHWPLAYAWKITFNETAKRLAFANVLPEANHNELEGFDGPEAERAALAEGYAPIFLTDPAGDARLARRFEVLEQLLTGRGLHAETVPLAGGTVWEKIFNSWFLANWTALALAQTRGLDPAAVPLIEELKKRLS